MDVIFSLFCFGLQVCVFHAWEEWAGLGQVEDYLSVLEYLVWVFTPLAVVFILPFLIVILLYLSILFLHVYKVCKHYGFSAVCECNLLGPVFKKTFILTLGVLLNQT